MECLTLWPTYIGEKGRILGKTYGIKMRCYWEHIWGTHWEPWEQRKNEKKSSAPCPSPRPPQTKNLKEKK